jgi:hypothetical protein
MLERASVARDGSITVVSTRPIWQLRCTTHPQQVPWHRANQQAYTDVAGLHYRVVHTEVQLECSREGTLIVSSVY